MAREESTPKTPFGARLRQIRKGYGIMKRHDPNYSAKAFAAELGVEGETYRTYERGESGPSIETLRRIREKTGISLDFLICGDPQEDMQKPVKSHPLREVRRA